MNKLANIMLTLAIFLFLTSVEYVAQNSTESNIKSALSNLLTYSKTKNFDKAANLIAYNGDDTKRIDKDSFNPANKDELNQVKRICKKISALLELSSSHEFGEFKTLDEKGKEEFTLKVTFVSGDQKLVTSFSFIKTDKGFLLNNMN